MWSSIVGMPRCAIWAGESRPMASDAVVPSIPGPDILVLVEHEVPARKENLPDTANWPGLPISLCCLGLVRAHSKTPTVAEAKRTPGFRSTCRPPHSCPER